MLSCFTLQSSIRAARQNKPPFDWFDWLSSLQLENTRKQVTHA